MSYRRAVRATRPHVRGKVEGEFRCLGAKNARQRIETWRHCLRHRSQDSSNHLSSDERQGRLHTCTKLLKVHIAQSDHRPIPAKDYEGNY